jgi:hypothetical protein
MIKRIQSALGVILLLASLQSHAQSAEDMKRLKQFREQVNKPVVYHTNGTELVKIDSNIIYEHNTYDGKMDIYQPKLNENDKKPLILIVHGKTLSQQTQKTGECTPVGVSYLQPKALSRLLLHMD